MQRSSEKCCIIRYRGNFFHSRRHLTKNLMTNGFCRLTCALSKLQLNYLLRALKSILLRTQHRQDLKRTGFLPFRLQFYRIGHNSMDFGLIVSLFQRLRQIGCFVTTSENVIFKLVKDKDHPKFNDIRGLVKDRSPHTMLVEQP